VQSGCITSTRDILFHQLRILCDKPQRNERLGALDMQLTPEDAAQLDRVSPWGGMIVPCYLDDGFADFQPHCYRW